RLQPAQAHVFGGDPQLAVAILVQPAYRIAGQSIRGGEAMEVAVRVALQDAASPGSEPQGAVVGFDDAAYPVRAVVAEAGIGNLPARFRALPPQVPAADPEGPVAGTVHCADLPVVHGSRRPVRRPLAAPRPGVDATRSDPCFAIGSQPDRLDARPGSRGARGHPAP